MENYFQTFKTELESTPSLLLQNLPSLLITRSLLLHHLSSSQIQPCVRVKGEPTTLFLLAPEQKHIKHIITHIIQRYLFMPTSSSLSTKHLAPHALFMALLLAPDALCYFPIFWKYSCEWEGKPFLAWRRKALAV